MSDRTNGTIGTAEEPLSERELQTIRKRHAACKQRSCDVGRLLATVDRYRGLALRCALDHGGPAQTAPVESEAANG